MTPAELPLDWPSIAVGEVKNEALMYANDLRGPWPSPPSLREAAVARLLIKLDTIANQVESEDSWFERYEQGALDKEIDAALEFYAQRVYGALA